MSSIVQYICNDCNKLVTDLRNIPNLAKDNFLCDQCFFRSSPVTKDAFDLALDTVIAEMLTVQGYQCEEQYIFYQLRSLLMETRQELRGGYLAMDYVQEKTEKIVSRCKEIAMRKGMYHE